MTLSFKPVLQRGLIALLVVCVINSLVLGKELIYPTGSHGKGELRYLKGIPVAVFSGSPKQIGEQHAALLGKPGAPLLKFSKTLLAQTGSESFWPLAVFASKRLMAQAPDRFAEELEAAAQHAQVDRDEIIVANTLLELRRLGCSTLVVEPARSTTGGLLFGRNFDFPPLGVLDKFSLVKIYRPTGKHAFAAIGYPGLVGVLSGMNDAGLALATLDVEATANGSPQFEPTGVPLMLVFRQILEECTTIDEVEQLLRETKATTWANLTVCDQQTGAVFEITPTEVARRNPNESLLQCTNHFRTERLAANTQCDRFTSLLTANQSAKLDVDAVHRHLDLANQGEFTLQTMIFEPSELVLHLAIGKAPSSSQELVRLDLRELLSPSR